MKAVNVKDFGAIGNGSTDDSTAFQAVLDQHAAIYLPAGTYRLDKPLLVQDGARRVIMGRRRR